MSLVRDLPDVSAGVAEARGADPPGSVDRPVEEFDPLFSESLAGGVDVLDAECELRSDSGRWGSDRSWRDQAGCLARSEQIDQRVAELEHGRVFVLEEHRKVEHFLVEALRALQILHEQRDRGDAAGPRGL